MHASDKHSSLLERSCKKFYCIDNQEENTNIETAKGSKAGILKLSYDQSWANGALTIAI
jgi:hypothetical protein